jgi:hypothetical protein
MNESGMIDSREFDDYMTRQLARTQEQIDNPVDVPSFPVPAFWEGYKQALRDVQGSAHVWGSEPFRLLHNLP